jgi:tetratricopeptide (TPR) repeat protein
MNWRRCRIVLKLSLLLAAAVAPSVRAAEGAEGQSEEKADQKLVAPSDEKPEPKLSPEQEAKLEEVAKLSSEVVALYRQGRFAAGIELARRALELCEQAEGADHPDVATMLNNLAMLQQAQGDLAAATPVYERALKIREAALGPDHPLTAQSLNNLATLLQAQGNSAAATPLLERALKIREAALGPDHPDVVMVLNNLGLLHQIEGKNDVARPYFERVLAIREKTLGPDHIEVATCLANLAATAQALGDFAAARPLFERALKINERALGPDHAEVAKALNRLGLVEYSQGEYAAAAPLFARALEINLRALGPEDHEVGASLNNLAITSKALGKYEEAIPLYVRALKILEETLGPRHRDVATTLNNLGQLYQELGKYGEAAPLLERSLKIREATLGPDDPAVGESLNNLALLFRAQGDFDAARPLLERALDIADKDPAANRRLAATSISNLALVFQSQGHFDAATPLFERGLAVLEQSLGPDHPDVATCLNSLASSYQDEGKYDAAKPLFERAIKIYERALGSEHPHVATSLNNLAGLYDAQGEYVAARPLYERSLAILERTLGASHPLVTSSYDNLCLLAAASGDRPQSIVWFGKVVESRRHFFEQELPFYSRRQVQECLEALSGEWDVLMSLSADGQNAATDLTWILGRKALAFESLCLQRKLQDSLAADPALGRQVGELQSQQQLLSRLRMTPTAGEGNEKIAAERDRLSGEVEQLSKDLLRQLAQRTKGGVKLAPSVAEVAAALPADGALVELASYAPYQFQAKGKEPRRAAPRYAALVCRGGPDKQVERIELGPAAEIDPLVAELAEQIAEAPKELAAGADEADLEASYRATARKLYAKVFAPLKDALGGARLIFLAPDGELHRVPLESLVDDDGRYLVEGSYEFTYLTSGRDLLRPTNDPGEGAYVFAAPNFNLPANRRVEIAAASKVATPSRGLNSASTQGGLIAASGIVGTRSLDSRGMRFEAYEGMKLEGEQAARLLADGPYGAIHAFQGEQALEERFKAIQKPRLVTLITHGYYLPDQEASPDVARENELAARGAFGMGEALRQLRVQEDPLLRSGVVLAGANTLDEPTDAAAVEDGWLTAEEISQLDFRGTQLVILSACNTARGDAATNQAVTGLRSALLFAGAESVVGSLFEVPDEATRELMTRFFAGLKESQGRRKLGSLDEAKRSFIAERRKTTGAAHPFFWASFVLVGKP